MKKLHVILTLVAVLLFSAGACSNDGCLDNKSSLPKASFYSSATGKNITLSRMMISGVGAPGDSVLVGPDQSVSELYLPMRSTQSSTSWCFSYKSEGLDFEELNDTVTFDYETQPYFVSDECGAIFRYLITRSSNTTHLIDSVVVVDSLITNVDMVRIKIFFRTAEEPENPEEPQE